MPVTPASLGRRYAPFIALAAVQVLLVAIVPSKVGKSSTDVAAFGTNGTGTAATGGTGGASGGEGGTVGTAGGDVSGGGGGTNGGGGGTNLAAGGTANGATAGPGLNSGDRSKCSPDGHQIGPTYFMPLCVPVW